MSRTTTNYSLIKPELTDAADITAMNENWDTIDNELKNHTHTAADVGALALDGSGYLDNQLYIRTSKGMMYIRPDEHGAYVYANQSNSNDVRYLQVSNLVGSPTMTDALRVVTFANGAYRTDRVYHEGNKPTPAEIGAVSRAEWEANLLAPATVE